MVDKPYFIDIDGLKIPVKVFIEKRLSTRVALGSSYIILRIPKGVIFNSNIDQHIQWATTWLKDLKAKKPAVLEKYSVRKEYLHYQLFKISHKTFQLHLNEVDSANGSIKLLPNDILAITIPTNRSYDTQKLIRTLIIKFCQNYFLPYFIQKVNHYNQKYFQRPINGVKLRYNKSNWGSCSSGKNLNFSIRLLFAPEEVIDYVIVHELAHLIEMNHSPRFWKIVENIIPDYKKKETVLKIHGSKFDF